MPFMFEKLEVYQKAVDLAADGAGKRLTTNAAGTANFGATATVLQKDTNYAYDGLHRLNSADYATDTQSQTFTYDHLGNRLTFVDRDASSTLYNHNLVNEYDKIGCPMDEPHLRAGSVGVDDVRS